MTGAAIVAVLALVLVVLVRVDVEQHARLVDDRYQVHVGRTGRHWPRWRWSVLEVDVDLLGRRRLSGWRRNGYAHSKLAARAAAAEAARARRRVLDRAAKGARLLRDEFATTRPTPVEYFREAQ